jgi:hypothetical protein
MNINLKDSILKNENIAFKVQSEININVVLIQRKCRRLGVAAVIFDLFFTYKYFQLETIEYLLAMIASSVLIFFLAVIYLNIPKLSQLFQSKNFIPEYIGTDDFLLIANGDKSVQIPWKYFSQDVKIKESNNQKGNVILRFDRKEFATSSQDYVKELGNSGIIHMMEINNPKLIGEICRTKIKQNGGPA